VPEPIRVVLAAEVGPTAGTGNETRLLDTVGDTIIGVEPNDDAVANVRHQQAATATVVGGAARSHLSDLGSVARNPTVGTQPHHRLLTTKRPPGLIAGLRFKVRGVTIIQDRGSVIWELGASPICVHRDDAC
jgi:hypothetical protein